MKLLAVATVVFIWVAILLSGVSRGQPEFGHRLFTERGLTPGGHQVRLDFLVRAGNEAQARRAIEAATVQLTGGQVAGQDDSTAAAAFVAWGWQWDAAEVPVAVAYNPAGATTPAEPAIENALATWSGVAGSRFEYRYAGETAAVPGVARGEFDGVNAIGWDALSCQDGCVLAVTSKAPGVHEADIVLNSDPLPISVRVRPGRPTWRRYSCTSSSTSRGSNTPASRCSAAARTWPSRP